MSATFHQPNPRFRSPADLNQRDREHFEVARSFGDSFTREEFLERYSERYPSRGASSIIPSDYCFDRDNKGNRDYPRFLIWHGKSLYSFTGLGRQGEQVTTPARADAPGLAKVAGQRVSRVPVSVAVAPRRFLWRPAASFSLNANVAALAIRAYNSDSTVAAQERRAFAALRHGFARGRVQEQLRALNAAYSTRSHTSDLERIAEAIEATWTRWTTILEGLGELREQVPDVGSVGALLHLFLDQETIRTPRSLSTKALHFAKPLTFSSVDAFTANTLGDELGAGRWADTASLNGAGMATWYVDYLGAVHNIGVANRDLLSDLLGLDRAMAPDHDHERVRGLPKIIDKIVWWIGKELETKGIRHRLFDN